MLNYNNDMLQIKYYDHERNEVYYEDDPTDIPRICAHCKNTGEQVLLEGILLNTSETLIITACQFCGEVTLHYFRTNPLNVEPTHTTVPPLIHNVSLEFSNISSEIQQKFPEFIKIMKQSQSAEQANLDQIAGMGYRKALEFLVTDFLLEYPQENISENWIKSPVTTLSQKIEKLPNERIKKLSKAISFIGNDETHYIRRHPEHDIESIKMFLKALISDLENEIILKEAETLLEKPK